MLRGAGIKIDDAAVYIHVKGYVRTRVTDTDIEDRVFGKIMHRGRGNMVRTTGVKGGIRIEPKKAREMEIDGSEIVACGLDMHHPIPNEVRASTVTCVGRKYHGIYIGLEGTQIGTLKQVAEKNYGVAPRRNT